MQESRSQESRGKIYQLAEFMCVNHLRMCLPVLILDFLNPDSLLK